MEENTSDEDKEQDSGSEQDSEIEDSEAEADKQPTEEVIRTRSGRVVKPTTKAMGMNMFKTFAGAAMCFAAKGACVVDAYGLINDIHPLAGIMGFMSSKGDPDTLTLKVLNKLGLTS